MYIFSTAYFPSIEYISKLYDKESIIIDQYENYTKQTYRNRCVILDANGKLNLTIPVVKVSNQKTVVKDIKISYDENWQKNQLRTIDSAYNSSPFYEFFKDSFIKFYENKFTYLLDFNTQILETLFEILELDTKIILSDNYVDSSKNDFRSILSPKVKTEFKTQKYTQVFDEKFEFMSNLSILDLICCEGNASAQILLNSK